MAGAEASDSTTPCLAERRTDEDSAQERKACSQEGLTPRCLVVILGFFCICVLLGKQVAPVMEKKMVAALGHFSAKSPTGCAQYVLIYATASCLGAPSTFFEVLAGFLFGWPLGVCLDTMGRILSATVSFGTARSLLSFGRGGMDHPWLEGVGQAVEEQGFPFLILFNLLYIPVAVKNYGLGFIPEVTLSKFIAAVLCVEIPMASIWAYVGATARAQGLDIEDAQSSRRHSRVGFAALAVAFAALLLVLRILQQKVSVVVQKHMRHRSVSSKSDRTMAYGSA
jgi:uncharacterized membrane protein YdjX (TVP38/TMEM64 family)